MSKIAIIPARGGSKRIPHKNIRDFCGKPIIVYSIKAALESELFDEVMVSTDDEEIASIARKYGASVPFMRSQQTANDHAILKDVLVEVIKCYTNLGKNCDEICCLLPTAPFVTSEDIIKSHSMLKSNECSSVVPIVKYSYPIFRSLKIENGLLKMNWPENYIKRSQDLPEAYHDAGLFYWYTDSFFKEEDFGFGSKTVPYVVSEEKTQDIDTEDDWRMAELKYRLLNV